MSSGGSGIDLAPMLDFVMNLLIFFIITAVFVLIALVAFIPSWIQKWLWMRQLGYTGVFWTI